jgi:hypothetical protein
MALDISDPEIAKVIAEVKGDSPTNWVMIGHAPKSDTKAKVLKMGTGGIEEVKDALNDGKVLFIFCAVPLGGMKKLIYISWCGEGVTGMKKGLFNNQSIYVSKNLFQGFHVQINARNEDDINVDQIMGRVKKAIGASFYKQHSAQNTESTPEVSTLKYERPPDDQTTENQPTGAHIHYEKRNENQTTENNPSRSNIRYERGSEDQTTENAPKTSAFRGAPPGRGRMAPPPSRGPPPIRGPPVSTPVSTPPPPKPQPVEEAPAEEAYEEEQEAYEEEAYEEEDEYPEETEGGAVGTCKAIYDYEAENDTDLSFKEGDVINIIDDSDPSGWYEGELNGVRGFFPSNFVERM